MRRYIYPASLFLASAAGLIMGVHLWKSPLIEGKWGIHEATLVSRGYGLLFSLVMASFAFACGLNELRALRGKPEVDYASFFEFVWAQIKHPFPSNK